MDTVFAIGLGLGLRAFIDAFGHNDYKLGGTLVGLWEGAVLHHFLDKRPKSSDAYFALGFRLLVDLAVTESLTRMTIVMLWTGLGVVLSDVLNGLWYDKGWRSFVEGLSRWGRRRRSSSSRSRSSSAAYSSLPFPFFKSLASSRVRFYEIPAPSARSGSAASSSSTRSQGSSDATVRSPRSILRSPTSTVITTPNSTSTPVIAPRRVRADLVPGFWSETETVTDAGQTRPRSYQSSTSTYDAPPRAPLARDIRPTREADEDYRVDSGMEEDGLTSPSVGSSMALPSIHQVIPPTVRLDPPTDSDASLEYADDVERTPRSNAPIMLPPIISPPSEVSITRALPMPPGLPDMSTIPDISVSTPTAVDMQQEPSYQMPPNNEIPDMSAMATPNDRVAREREWLEERPERPMSQPPAYPDVPPIPSMVLPSLPESELTPNDSLSNIGIANSHVSAAPSAQAGPSSSAAQYPAEKRALGGSDRGSIISTRTSVLLRDAEQLKEQAKEKEAEVRRQDSEYKRALREKRPHDALKHKVQKEELEEDARKAKERAESKLYRANNRHLNPQQIDVRGLRSAEAIRRTERAISDSYERGETELVVIVGKPDKGQTQSVRTSVLKALRDLKIQVQDNNLDLDQLLITLPTSPM